MTMRIRIDELLDELDGDGIIWSDSDLTTKKLSEMGLAHFDSLLYLSKLEWGTIKNALVTLQVIAIDGGDKFMQELAEKSIEFLGKR